MQIWRRARRFRRLYLSLKKKYLLLKKVNEQEKQRLISHYEKRLAIEQTKVETLHSTWANRFLQLQKLSSLGVSTSLIEEVAESRLLNIGENSEDLEEDLTPQQYLELENRRERFLQDGLSMNKSPAEIHNRWKDIRDTVVSDVKRFIN